MEIIFYIIVFIFGLAVGSFLNCVIYRLEKKESFLKGRSYCPHCKHKLSWQDLIPLFSFLILRGKCRYCQKKISWQYPLVEITTGLLFVLIFNFQFSPKGDFWLPVGQAIFNQFSIFNFQNLIYLCFLFLVSCFLLIIFVYDLKHYIIPNKIIYPLIGITFLYQIFKVLDFGNWNFILSALFASGFFLAIVLISKGRWMGLGDVKLAFFMGLFLASPNILAALFFAFTIGAIIGVGLILGGKKALKSELPFGPFLILGTLIAFFWGQEIIQWYLQLFVG